MTENLSRRIFEHKQRLVDGFTKRYNVDKLFYYEVLADLKSAVKREK
jgi:putative endonuclease